MLVMLFAGCTKEAEIETVEDVVANDTATADTQAVENVVKVEDAEKTADYPLDPVTVLIPYSPGGGSDILTRAIMQYIELPNDTKLVALNIDGASGYIGLQTAANSPNDGYTILAHNPMDVVSYTLSGVTDIPIWSDMEMVAGIVDDYNVVCTNPQSGWTTIEEFVAYCKANPGVVKVGTVGSLTVNMADTIRVLEALGVSDDVTVVPYDGGSECKTANMGNHIQIMVNSCADIQSSVESGDAIPLLTIGSKRANYLPDTPSTADLGFEVQTSKPRGWYAPEGMDQAKIKVLQDALEVVCANPEFIDKMAALGLEVNYVEGSILQEKITKWVEELQPIFDELRAE
jgi:tripartite-type tricarboxylate transporter receptor subunit TctC